MSSVMLSNIPKKVQDEFGIGPEIKVQVSDDVMGGRFMFTNEKGEPISVDAVELTGTGIIVEELVKCKFNGTRCSCGGIVEEGDNICSNGHMEGEEYPRKDFFPAGSVGRG